MTQQKLNARAQGVGNQEPGVAARIKDTGLCQTSRRLLDRRTDRRCQGLSPLRLRSSRQIRQFRCLILVNQRVDNFIERLTGENPVDLIERHIDPMIGDAPLREIIGADALGPVAGADLAAALGGALGIQFRALRIVHTGAKHLHRPSLYSCAAIFRPGS